MNPILSLYKKIGIALGVVVLGAVGTVTAVSEKKAPVVAVTNNVPAPTATVSRWFSDDDGEDEGGNRTTQTPVPVPPPATTPKNYVSTYKNGTYSANGTYSSPGGQDQIAVTITLVNDIVTDATVTSVIADNTSLKYQNRFISGYKQYVVGQNISSLNLTVFSGSSLTPIGFNDALAQIKAQAKV